MGVEIGLQRQGKDTERGCSIVGCRGRYLGAKREEATGELKKLHNEELSDLNCSPNGDQTKNEVDAACGTYEKDGGWIWGCGRET